MAGQARRHAREPERRGGTERVRPCAPACRSSAIGVQLATHPVPPLRKIGVSLQPTSWTVKDVCKVLKAVGLEEYMELFVEHRVQGDVIFNLTEENLREMGVDKVGDRLLITDITQTLYEQVTGWQEQKVQPTNLLQLGQ